MRNISLLSLIVGLGLMTSRGAYGSCVKNIDCEGGLVCENGACVLEASPLPQIPMGTSGCGKDTECKGNRICVNGECVDQKAPVAASSVAVDPDAPVAQTGWAAGASVMGFVAIPIVAGLGVASALTVESQIPSIPLGASATLVLGVIAPLTARGARSARQFGGVRGSLGLRIPAWIFYGLTMANAVVLIAQGVAREHIQAWQVSLSTGMGNIALLFFAIDALISHSQAKRILSNTASLKANKLLSVAPTLTPIRGHDGLSGAILGMGGHF